jgi:predicted ABC-type transport system involved in lysophospholipase L1 biosynthesis ATPase subunit
MTEAVLIEGRQIRKSYRRRVVDGEETILVLDGADLAVRARESLAVCGDSGTGKSTLLNILGGLDRPDSGQVFHRGAELPVGIQDRARWRRHEVGFIFQFHGLLPELTALENVALAGLVAGWPASRALAAAAQLLEPLGLAPRATHFPSELSGGEQQRVSIGRALFGSPSAVFADEPTGNLDPRTGDRVLDLLFQLQRRLGFALVVATHSSRLARRCDRIVRLAQGRLADSYADDLEPPPASDAAGPKVTVNP